MLISKDNHLLLERDKGDTGDWDIFRVSLGDGDYYKSEMKIVTYESDKYDKGENYSFKATVTLNGKVFNDVYYLKQERRPFEIYYTEQQGIVAFKLSALETLNSNLAHPLLLVRL